MPESVRFESPTDGFPSQWYSKRMRAQQTQIKSMHAAFPVTGPFRPAQPGDFSLLRERLRVAGFTEKSASEVLEGKSDRNIDMAYVIRRTAATITVSLACSPFPVGHTRG